MTIDKKTQDNKVITTVKFNSKEDGAIHNLDLHHQAGLSTVDEEPFVGYGKGIVKNVKVTFNPIVQKIIGICLTIVFIVLVVFIIRGIIL